MKTFATYALMAAAMAVKLQMLQEETDKPETKRVEDMDKDDFSPEELECISMAVEGGLREKGMEGEELEATKERFHKAAEEGATLGDGVEELRKMGREADMSEGDIDETLEKMFDRAHKCGERKKERKEKEDGSGSEGEGEELAQKREMNSGDEAELRELMESTAADLGEKKLRCMGKAIKEGLQDKGMPEGEADAAVEVLAGGAEAGKKVKEGVDYLRTLGEEAGLDTDDQDEVLLGMAEKARECAEKSSDDEEEVALAQQDSEEPASEAPKSEWDSDDKSEGTWSEKGSWDSEDDVSGSDSWSAKSGSWSAKSGSMSAKSGMSAKSMEMAQEEGDSTDGAEESESDGEGPSEDGEEKSQKGGEREGERKGDRGDKDEGDKEERKGDRGDKGEGEDDKEERKGGDKKGGRRGDKKEDDGEESEAEAPAEE